MQQEFALSFERPDPAARKAPLDIALPAAYYRAPFQVPPFLMANTKSAQKANRQTKTRTIRNRAVKHGVRLARKAVLAAVDAGDTAKANEALAKLASAADKASKGNVIHKNRASRMKSRMALQISKIGTEALKASAPKKAVRKVKATK